MNNNSNELDFIYYFNKSLLLIEHVDKYYQKEILDDIKRTTNELHTLFSKNYLQSFCNLIIYSNIRLTSKY